MYQVSPHKVVYNWRYSISFKVTWPITSRLSDRCIEAKSGCKFFVTIWVTGVLTFVTWSCLELEIFNFSENHVTCDIMALSRGYWGKEWVQNFWYRLGNRHTKFCHLNLFRTGDIQFFLKPHDLWCHRS